MKNLTLRVRRGKYYARIRKWDGLKVSEQLIPHRTTPIVNKDIKGNITFEPCEKTIKQMAEIKEVLHLLLNGTIQKHQFKEYFDWLNENKTSKLIKLRLKDVIPDYLIFRMKTTKNSFERDEYVLKQFTRCPEITEDKIIEELNYKDIEGKFIPYYLDKGYGNNGINISCRHLKIFFTYLYRENLIKERIRFKMLPKDDTPCYISREEINALHDAVDDKFARWFKFYEMCGCRATDPFKGYLKGNVWVIPPDQAKTKHTHYYPLNDEMIAIWKELQGLKQHYIDMDKSEDHAIMMSYNVIRRKLNATIKSLRKDGIIAAGKKLTLKSFRHTFGITNVVKTGDIWRVSKMMNHKSIGVTQEYLDIDHYIILQDFPELEQYLVVNMPNFQSEPNPEGDVSKSPLPYPLGHTNWDTKTQNRNLSRRN